MSDLQTLGSLTPQVAIVVAFIWYLSKRDKAFTETLNIMSKRMGELAKVISSLEGRLKSIEKTRVHDLK